MFNNPDMMAALLAAILGQEQLQVGQTLMLPNVQMAQYGRDYHNNPEAGEYYSYPGNPPGTTDFPMRRFPRNESSQPKGIDPRQPRGLQPDRGSGSIGDDFYEETDRRNGYKYRGY